MIRLLMILSLITAVLASDTTSREINWKYFEANYPKHRSVIDSAAEKFDHEPLLIAAICCWENPSWYPGRKSPTWDIGMMQIHVFDTTNYDYINRLKNPRYNIMKGSRILRNRINAFKSDLDAPDTMADIFRGLTAYNLGEGGAESRGRVTHYAMEVVRFWHKLELYFAKEMDIVEVE